MKNSYKIVIGIVIALIILAGLIFFLRGDDVKTAVIQTNKGEIVVELYEDKAPVTIKNFENYVNSEFYAGTVFHRVIDGFMIQGGGFTVDGAQKSTNVPIELESDNGLNNLRGTVAMARTADPDSATSQFFINTVDNGFLDYTSANAGYAVFGKVVEGMDVVETIEKIETGTRGYFSDWPVEEVIIERIYFR